MKFFDPYKLRGKLIIFVIGITSKAQRLKDSKTQRLKNSKTQRLKDSKSAISKTIKMKFLKP